MGPTDSRLNTNIRRDFETFLDRWRGDHEVPGASVAVVDREGIRYAAGQGASDVRERTPATAETRYPFASVSKLVTAVSVLQLVDEDRVALDDPINGYIDLWADVPGDPITVEELLTHTSGMPADYAGERTYLFSEDPPVSPLVTLEDLRRHIDAVADQRITEQDRFMYNDRGYQILGLLVETVEERPFEAVVEEKIFDPLGMNESTIGYGPLSEIDDAITGYTIEEGVPTPVDIDLDTRGLGPAVNGVLAPVTEMALLVRCLMNSGELDGTRLLDTELADAMCTCQVTTRETIDGARHGMGYGPRVQEFLGEKYIYHSGTVPGIGQAFAGFLPNRGVGVTIGVNTAGVRIGVLGRSLLAILAGESPEESVPYLALRGKLQAVAGTYESPRGAMTVEVEPAGSNSYIEISAGDWAFPAFPETTAIDEYEFHSVWAGGWRGAVEFHQTGEGMELRLLDHRLQKTRVQN